jgi:site-specific DNA recombinase
MKVALYARYSSENQRDASITDQLRICRAHADKQGWQIVEEYTDHAISGASLLRPGIQALMLDGQNGRFDIVLAEAMDRLSRDQEDIAGLYKRMTYGGMKIVTLSEGEVSHLHIGLKGTMNALFLKDLADKTRRGLQGRIQLGKSGGGNAYGYDVVRKLNAIGEPDRGDRTINTTEADVVRRIFRDYIDGKSPKRIAVELNQDGISAPTGGDWGFTTIIGNAKRGTGILNNEMYVGRLVWNRQRFVKDPDTGKRQARLNPADEWIIKDVPELRIVDSNAWDAVKAKQAAIKVKRNPDGKTGENQFWDRTRPKYLLSGLTKCGCCGGGYSMVSGYLLGCSTARNKGTCDNRVNIRRDQLEERVLAALRHHLMEPALFAEFCGEFTLEMNRLRIDASASIDSAKAEAERIKRELDKIMELYLKDAMPIEVVKQKSDILGARKKELESFLATATEPPPLLHPEMATFYRVRVAELYSSLQSDAKEQQLAASEAFRSLVDEIILTPENGELKIDVRGDLAGILSIALKRKNPASSAGSLRVNKLDDAEFQQSQVKLVAGAGFEPTTFRL